MKRALFLAVAVAAVSGCSTMTPARYAPSADNNQALRKYEGSRVQLRQVVPPESYSANCRVMGPIQAADGQSIPEFIRNAFNTEFKFANIYSADGVTLDAAMTKIEFSSISGLTDGWWELGIILKSSNGKWLEQSSRTEFKSGFDAITGCNQTAQALGGAVQDLIRAAVTDPAFKGLLELSTAPAQAGRAAGRQASAAAALPAPAAASPSKQAAAIASLPAYMPHAGDRWKYQYVDGFNGTAKEVFVHEVVAASVGKIDEKMYVDGGSTLADQRAFTADSPLVLVERRLRRVDRLEFDPYLQAFTSELPFRRFGPLTVPAPDGAPWEFKGRVLGNETVSVPAGTFDTMKIELNGTRGPGGGPPRASPVQARYVIWYAPKAKRYVKYEVSTWNQYFQPLDKDRFELLDFKLN